MAVEKKRGCGYRKVGGLYLVSSGQGVPCDRLPIRLDVCPVCSHGFKQTRGFTWVDLCGLVGGNHEEPTGEMAGPESARFPVTALCDCRSGKAIEYGPCPLCHNVKEVGKAGLLWVGEKFYKTPAEFMAEGHELGFSRRVSAIPRNFKVGQTWVMVAHPKGDRTADYFSPEELEARKLQFETINGIQWVYFPAIFTLWRPSRIEKIFKESDRHGDEVKKALEQGITPVFVPDDDKDHAGTVYDKAEEDPEEVAAT